MSMDYNTPPPYPPMPGQPVGGPAAPGAPAKGKRGKNKDKAPTKRVVDRQKVIAGIFALLVFGGVAGQYALRTAPNLYVVRVATDVPALSQVDQSNLTATPVTADQLEPGAISGHTAAEAEKNAQKVIGQYAQYPLHAKQQVHTDEFSTNGTLLSQPLGPDERLISVRASVASSVAGTIRPGDHVDVLAAATNGSGMAGVVASDVPVVSVTVNEDAYNNASSQQAGTDRTKKASDLLPTDPIPGTYVLRVKSSLMTKLAVVDAGARVYLAYRGDGASLTQNTPMTVQQAICDGAVGIAGC